MIPARKRQHIAIAAAMSTSLRLLTVAAGLVILPGGALLLAVHGQAATAFTTFAGEPASLTSLPLILKAAFAGGALQMIQLGILLLIATPVVRVACVGVGFLLEKDWLYVVVTGIVLCVLIASFFRH